MTALATLQEFCQGIGLPAPQALPVALVFERAGRVAIESRDDDHFLVFLSRQVPVHQHGVARAALRAVDPARGLPFLVRVAFRGEDTLIFVASIAASQLDIPTLDHLVTLLARMADEAEQV